MGVGTGGVVDMCTGEVVRGQLSTAGKGNTKRSTRERQVGATLAAEAEAISATILCSFPDPTSYRRRMYLGEVPRPAGRAPSVQWS